MCAPMQACFFHMPSIAAAFHPCSTFISIPHAFQTDPVFVLSRRRVSRLMCFQFQIPCSPHAFLFRACASVPRGSMPANQHALPLHIPSFSRRILLRFNNITTIAHLLYIPHALVLHMPFNTTCIHFYVCPACALILPATWLPFQMRSDSTCV